MCEIKKNIASNIAKYRKLMKLSQQELADKIGVKRFTTVSSWERGGNIPDVEVLFKLCTLFNISVDEMYGVKRYMNNLAEDSKRFEAISEYFKKMGFDFQYSPIKGHTEDVKNSSNKIIGKAQNIDEYEFLLFKNGLKAVFTESEFEELQNGVKETIEGRFYKKVLEQKKK